MSTLTLEDKTIEVEFEREDIAETAVPVLRQVMAKRADWRDFVTPATISEFFNDGLIQSMFEIAEVLPFNPDRINDEIIGFMADRFIEIFA